VPNTIESIKASSNGLDNMYNREITLHSLFDCEGDAIKKADARLILDRLYREADDNLKIYLVRAIKAPRVKMRAAGKS